MTIPPYSDTADAWRTLELGGGSDEFSLATVRLAVDAGYGPVRLARGPAGELQVLIPTQAGRRLAELAASEAAPARVVQFVVGGRTQHFIQLSCSDPELYAPFRLLAEDVIRHLQAGVGPEQAVAASVAEFRDLLRKPSAHSLEVLVGLFGELRLLNELLDLNPSAAGSWTGPLRQRYDFSTVSLCAEVKSTLKRVDEAVRITSLEQLQLPSDGRELVLVHTVLERSGSGGQSVRDLITQAMARAVDNAVLEEALRAMQIDDWRQNDRLAAERFSVVRVQVFRVEGTFPRIEPSSFQPGLPPAGIRSVQYDIDLGHCRSWLVPPAQHSQLLKSLANLK